MIEDLFAYYADHLEALFAADAVDDHVSVNANEVFRVEYRVLVLRECIASAISLFHAHDVFP